MLLWGKEWQRLIPRRRPWKSNTVKKQTNFIAYIKSSYSSPLEFGNKDWKMVPKLEQLYKGVPICKETIAICTFLWLYW